MVQTVQFSSILLPVFQFSFFASSSRFVWLERHKNPPQWQRVRYELGSLLEMTLFTVFSIFLPCFAMVLLPFTWKFVFVCTFNWRHDSQFHSLRVTSTALMTPMGIWDFSCDVFFVRFRFVFFDMWCNAIWDKVEKKHRKKTATESRKESIYLYRFCCRVDSSIYVLIEGICALQFQEDIRERFYWIWW